MLRAFSEVEQNFIPISDLQWQFSVPHLTLGTCTYSCRPGLISHKSSPKVMSGISILVCKTKLNGMRDAHHSVRLGLLYHQCPSGQGLCAVSSFCSESSLTDHTQRPSS